MTEYYEVFLYSHGVGDTSTHSIVCIRSDSQYKDIYVFSLVVVMMLSPDEEGENRHSFASSLIMLFENVPSSYSFDKHRHINTNHSTYT